MKTRGRTTILTPSNEPVGTDEQGLTPIKPARSIGKKLSPGNFSFPFSRPQSGNSDLVSYRAVSDSYPSLFLGDRSPAKGAGANRAEPMGLALGFLVCSHQFSGRSTWPLGAAFKPLTKYEKKKIHLRCDSILALSPC